MLDTIARYEERIREMTEQLVAVSNEKDHLMFKVESLETSLALEIDAASKALHRKDVQITVLSQQVACLTQVHTANVSALEYHRLSKYESK